MGKERNKRARSEATFLEVIKLQMQHMQDDIMIIKKTLLQNVTSPKEHILPIPPPPFCYDRESLLACRYISEGIPAFYNKLPSVSPIEDIQLSSFLRLEGHFDNYNEHGVLSGSIEVIPMLDRIHIAQEAAKFRRDEDVDREVAWQDLQCQGGQNVISVARFPNDFRRNKQRKCELTEDTRLDAVQEFDVNENRASVLKNIEIDDMGDIVSALEAHTRELLQTLRSNIRAWPPVLGNTEEEGRALIASLVCDQVGDTFQETLLENEVPLSSPQLAQMRERLENIVVLELDEWKRSLEVDGSRNAGSASDL